MCDAVFLPASRCLPHSPRHSSQGQPTDTLQDGLLDLQSQTRNYAVSLTHSTLHLIISSNQGLSLNATRRGQPVSGARPKVSCVEDTHLAPSGRSSISSSSKPRNSLHIARRQHVQSQPLRSSRMKFSTKGKGRLPLGHGSRPRRPLTPMKEGEALGSPATASNSNNDDD